MRTLVALLAAAAFSVVVAAPEALAGDGSRPVKRTASAFTKAEHSKCNRCPITGKCL